LKLKDETVLATAGRDPAANHGVVNPPVYRASTILFPSIEALDDRQRDRRKPSYGRSGVPTTFDLEDALAALEGAAGAVVTGSGKTAIVQAMMALLEAGDHVLMVDSAYGPTRQFCDRVLSRFGVEVTYYDPLIGSAIEGLIQANTKIVYLESPGSLTFEIQDVPAIAARAHAAGALVMLDNTWATPLYFKPLEHGVDVALYAGTKYFGGHSDLMIGMATATEAVLPRLRRGMQDLGCYVSPDDCWLTLRGLRTLAVRLERHWRNGLHLAEWLASRPEVERVLHPALPGAPGYELWRRDFRGASGLFGVVLAPCPPAAVAALVDGLELFGIGYSWGGYESLAIPTHPERYRTATTWDASRPSLRIHAGLEAPEDLIADLEAGFARLNAAR
jgi:cystathionine beta-lyase